ncbi:carbon storage regulator, CsrA (plasmid) [Thioalkalivibrio sp. K90mix]|uniref:carbon storage regulator n=1 Tax=Thioalkalivibrio sp. (strain K90mix) TaxID=396595 RepID=UPI000195A844|nr:carbon storage regulator [Thioalkalivibrio sp. K90mix]ADC73329.1 carbon storage regulator, CsrA [Thioalkalivibrio sp. K90mix]
MSNPKPNPRREANGNKATRKPNLILGRRQGESLHINVDGRTIVVEVAMILGSQVRIGIQADRDVEIVRSELLERARQEASDDEDHRPT